MMKSISILILTALIGSCETSSNTMMMELGDSGSNFENILKIPDAQAYPDKIRSNH